MRVNGTEQQQGLIRHLIRRGRKSESTDLSHVDQSVSAVVQLSLRHLYLAQSSTDIATVSQQTVGCANAKLHYVTGKYNRCQKA